MGHSPGVIQFGHFKRFQLFGEVGRKLEDVMDLIKFGNIIKIMCSRSR